MNPLILPVEPFSLFQRGATTSRPYKCAEAAELMLVLATGAARRCLYDRTLIATGNSIVA